MAEEIWKPIPEWPYEASSSGRIRRAAKTPGGPPGRVLNVSLHKKGLGSVNLCMNGTTKNFRPGRLVCMAFHGPPPHDRSATCYRDDNPLNTVPDNLYWGQRGAKPKKRLDSYEIAELQRVGLRHMKFRSMKENAEAPITKLWKLSGSGSESDPT